MQRLIPQEVKNKVYEVTEQVLDENGNVEINEVQAVLERDHGICFFNMVELEKLIREGLEKQIFAYVGQKREANKKICLMTPSKSQILIINEIHINECKTSADLIFKSSKVGELDLSTCELKKLDRTDGGIEYYKVIEKKEEVKNV